MAYRIGKDGIENPTLKGWDKVKAISKKHSRRVRWRAYRTYRNYPAMIHLVYSGGVGVGLLLIAIAFIIFVASNEELYKQVYWERDYIYIPYYSNGTTLHKVVNNGIKFGKMFIPWVTSLVYVFTYPLWLLALDESCEKRYNNYCREKFIWPRDVSYYNVYVKDDEQLTIEEWKPVRYAYHLYQNESTMHHPFKVWYRNQCKRVVHFDKFCKLRNHLIS